MSLRRAILERSCQKEEKSARTRSREFWCTNSGVNNLYKCKWKPGHGRVWFGDASGVGREVTHAAPVTNSHDIKGGCIEREKYWTGIASNSPTTLYVVAVGTFGCSRIHRTRSRLNKMA